MRNILFAVSVLILLHSCKNKLEYVITKTELRDGMHYVEVEIPDQAAEELLKEIAEDIRKNNPDKQELIIAYFLSSYPSSIGISPWALATYNPDLYISSNGHKLNQGQSLPDFPIYETVSEMIKVKSFFNNEGLWEIIENKPLHIRISSEASYDIPKDKLDKISKEAIMDFAFHVFAYTTIEEITITHFPVLRELNLAGESVERKAATDLEKTVIVKRTDAQKAMQASLNISDFTKLFYYYETRYMPNDKYTYLVYKDAINLYKEVVKKEINH